jgi:antitoxin (DNA-binding transcriptional repressor) of toxin-antitoxin stability system
MATTVTLEEAQIRLAELIEHLAPGDAIVITRENAPVARLMREPPTPRREPRKPGVGKGMITLLVEDEEHLEGFAEYMP